MLYRIVEKDHFADCIRRVKNLYWPEGQFQECRSEIPPDPITETKVLEHMFYDKVFKPVSDRKNYPVLDPNGKEGAHLQFPFLDRFYKHFGHRHWSKPVDNPSNEFDDLIRLHATQNAGNFSEYSGNYHHFINVVAALARLVGYFNSDEHVKEVLGHNISKMDLHHGNSPDMRSFKLMIAGFWHDIGKTIIDPRHAMEGATILQ
jgi:hypothetical protein